MGRPNLRRPRARDFSFVFCTWFGLGRLPYVPGTWGSLGALPFAWALQLYGGPWLLAVAAVLISLVAIVGINHFLVHWPGDDPGEVVVDEVGGQWLTLVFVPPDLLLYLIGFVVFRFFDMTKIWPASWADRELTGAPGVLIDDVFAGIYGMLTMLVLMHFW